MTSSPHIDLVFHDATNACPVGTAFFARVIRHGLAAVKAPAKRYEISVSIVGSSKMLALNKKFRKKNAATDVLSFPVGVQYGQSYTIMALGDIFVCLPIVRKKAATNGTRIKQELAWAVAHGFLHLYGYNHEQSDRQAKLMERLEKRILKS